MLPFDRPLFPSNFSSQCTSFLTAEDTWTAQAPPADVTSTRRLESRHSMSHTTCTAHRKLGPCLGLYFRWKCILLYIGSINSLVHSFTFFSHRLTTLCQFSLFYLGLLPLNTTTPSSTLRSPPRSWIQFTKTAYISNANFFCQCRRDAMMPTYSFPFPLVSFQFTLRVAYLSLLPWTHV